jgi:hypothetical protein
MRDFSLHDSAAVWSLLEANEYRFRGTHDSQMLRMLVTLTHWPRAMTASPRTGYARTVMTHG